MNRIFLFSSIIVLLIIVFASCKQDLGPYREVTKAYPLTGFDRLDMGSGFHVDVRAGNSFQVEVRGNEADVNDLQVITRNGLLHVEYTGTGRKQRYDAYFTITMPTLRGVVFSGAVKSTITRFTNLAELNVELSGASRSDISATATKLSTNLSGASSVNVVGSGNELIGELSGASKLEAYDFPISQATLDVSGASTARVRVLDALTVKASGASTVRYRGTPRVNSNITGASTLSQD